MRQRTITISTADHARLLKAIEAARKDWRVAPENLDALEQELARATIVEPEAIPGDVVTMNSTVWFRDLDSDEIEHYTLVYPQDADVVHDRISVFAPIGTALLGFRVHDLVEWDVPAGRSRLKITSVAQQEKPAELSV